MRAVLRPTHCQAGIPQCRCCSPWLPTLLLLQFDVDFPRMPCSWLSLDAMDISGEMHLDVVSSCKLC